jgi:hypothetical protein
MIPEVRARSGYLVITTPTGVSRHAEALEHGRLPRCCLPQDRAYRTNAGALRVEVV